MGLAGVKSIASGPLPVEMGIQFVSGLGVSMSARAPLMNLIEGQPWVFEADLDIRGGIDNAAY